MSNIFPKEASEAEFKAFYFQLYPILFKLSSYILKDAVEAEDVVQEVFLSLWKKKEELNKIEDLKSYSIRIVQNKAFDILKASKREKDKILELERVDEISNNPELDKEADIRKVLERAVSQLSPKCRLIFSLSRFEGLSNDEISEYLEISKRTVETQISNALKAFRGELKPIFEYNLPHLQLSSMLLLLLHT